MKNLTREEFEALVEKCLQIIADEESRNPGTKISEEGIARTIYAVFTGGTNEKGEEILAYMDIETETEMCELITQYEDCEMPSPEIAPEIFNHIQPCSKAQNATRSFSTIKRRKQNILRSYKRNL